jgi:hypothetical protein
VQIPAVMLPAAWPGTPHLTMSPAYGIPSSGSGLVAEAPEVILSVAQPQNHRFQRMHVAASLPRHSSLACRIRGATSKSV